MAQINQLVVEVTRKCNMACEHCLRGKAQNKNIDFQYIDSLLGQVNYISNLTFSGGEPTLNVPAITYFLQKAKENKVSIGSFYIATNGMKVTEQFVIECLKLYAYCDEKDMCMVQVSNDIFHSYCGDYSTELLDGLSFFKRKFKKERYQYEYNSLIRQGNAAENFPNCGRIEKVYPVKTLDDFQDATIYLNVRGNIINGCDWSYKNQKSHKLCRIEELTNFINKLS